MVWRMTGSAGGAGSFITLKASQNRGGGAGGGDWVGFQTDTKGGAEALLNNETLLNESFFVEFNKNYESTVETVELEIYVELHHKCIVGNDTGK